tara:strand:- start:504 stop:791 length:288 start_codon:yes stop_codon:yes gene_type:complete
MESKYVKCWNQHGNWGIWSFPKRNRVLLWNDNSKKYAFYEMAPEVIEKNKRKAATADELSKRNGELANLRLMAWGLAAALGISLAVILLNILNAI